MEYRTQFWLSTCLAGILMILVIAHIWLYQTNSNRQTEVSERQALIQQAAQLEGLNRDLLKTLASFTVAQGDKPADKQIEQMLGNLGIKVTPTPTQAAPQAAGAKTK